MRRFNPDDTLSPGPGAYVAPDSVQVHDEKRGIASYKSTLERKETQVVPGADAPGVGIYLTDKHKSLGYQEIEGGAPNNFLFLYRAKNPAVPVNSDPRLPETVNISKYNDSNICSPCYRWPRLLPWQEVSQGFHSEEGCSRDSLGQRSPFRLS